MYIEKELLELIKNHLIVNKNLALQNYNNAKKLDMDKEHVENLRRFSLESINILDKVEEILKNN